MQSGNQANWKEIAELTGIAAIVASLIFVGMQMKQSHEIALAAQYHERTVLAVEWLHTQHDTSDLQNWANVCSPEIPSDVTPERAGHGCINLYSFLTISDNHLFQYEAGFLDEESWRTRRETIKRAFMDPVPRYIITHKKFDFRESFVDLGNELIAEIDAEQSN